MRRTGSILRLSASDVASHLACRHLTELNRAVAEGRLTYPHFDDSAAEALVKRGLEHEREYLHHLSSQGLDVVQLEEHAPVERTMAEMRRGADVIAQATLAKDQWFGIADVLRKVPGDSQLGDFHYQPHDTKLAKTTKGAAILQLCLYCDLLEQLQGRLPALLHVVPPGVGFQPQSIRVRDVFAYYRFVKARLETELTAPGDPFRHYPEPVPLCEVCRWASRCEKRLRDDDHLSLVASITRGQRRELTDRSVTTLEDLALEPIPLRWRPERGSVESLERTARQAQIQSASRNAAKILHELLPRETGRGFALLPAPSEGDIFFDIEGDPFVGTGGLEYLFGFAVVDSGVPHYEDLWALDAASEKAMFEKFVDRVMTTWAQHPSMHVYHYAPYEPSAMKRLMGRYGTRADEIDRMLRAGLFVDLFRVVRQAVRAGVESYSIKRLEPLVGYRRSVPLPKAGDARHELELALEFKCMADVTAELKELVRGYNEDDCLSAFYLRAWLEARREELAAQGEQVARPSTNGGEAPEKIAGASAAVKGVYDRLVENVPMENRSEEQQGRWLLAQLLDFHRREEKTKAWEQRQLAEMDAEELFEERHAVFGLTFESTVGGKKVPIDRYHFPPQDCDLEVKTKLFVPDGEWGRPFGEVVAIDAAKGTIDVKKMGATATEHPQAIYGFKRIGTEEHSAALLTLGQWVADHGIDAKGQHRAARDLLLRLGPRGPGQPLRMNSETSVQAASRLVLSLKEGVLAIQGPPGAGKTYTAARLICALVEAGKTIGITATGHKVIDSLLADVLEASGGKVRCGRKGEEGSAGITLFGDNPQAHAALTNRDIDVLGGTSWLWCRPEFANSVDVLVVDEAGQFSLANALAAAQAADNLVLLGDPRQLEQPIKASHPDGAEASALDHLLGANVTIPDHQGLFLAETHRLHPAICGFTSELFYEERLQAEASCARQALTNAGRFSGAGLHHMPVAHQGNTSHSPEEAEAVAAIVAELAGANWTDKKGNAHKLRRDEDILIVAPYNAQVAELSRRLPGMRIGTVDKFQGQEAPAVILSMAASSVDDAPRGMDFLYSPNRLNVATSRAQAVCIIVASPRLFEPDCHSPKQMKLANVLCRYRELADRPDTASSTEVRPVEPPARGFDLLHPAVQRRLWEMKWTNLRPIQDRAIEHIIGRRGDCVISAPTSGGKTEAAFLPTLSMIAESPGTGARILYVSPLKALINDQFRRIEDLCKRMEMPVHKWHGDVDDSARRAFLDQPSGVVLITPESLEAMFVLRPTMMPALFQGLRFVVIDELHALLGSVRGAQLQSQLYRLQQRCKADPVRIGLSATIGDPPDACAWLRPGGPPAAFLEDKAQRSVAIRMKGYKAWPPSEDQKDESPDDMPRQLAREILRSCHSTTNLIFANAKSQIEELADAMKAEATAMGVRHEVVVHHGSLSKEQREYAEDRLRQQVPCSAVCSNTLELGIDIGEVDNVVQVSAPWSVSSLTQRLGRSGRRDQGEAVLRGLLVENKLDEHSSVWDGLHVDFLRGVAMVELMLQKYVEPPAVHRAQLSTLVQQLLSTLAETGGCAAQLLFERLTVCGAFGPLSRKEFASILRSLGAAELIEQMEGGDLILGPKGQRLCEHYSFYAAFVSPEEFRVINGSDPIGMLPASMLPLPGEHVILAGRRWLVREIRAESREVLVVPGKGHRAPRFRSMGSGISARVQQEMLALAKSERLPDYLDATAKDLLSEVRSAARGVDNFAPVMRELEGADRTQIFVWAGSAILRTLYLAFRDNDLMVDDHEVGLEVHASRGRALDVLSAVQRGSLDGNRLADLAARQCGARIGGDKYDWVVPEELWRRSYVSEHLDLDGARMFATKIVRV